MREPHYPAARTFAARLEAHFAEQLVAGPQGPPAGVLLPDAVAIEALIGHRNFLFGARATRLAASKGEAG